MSVEYFLSERDYRFILLCYLKAKVRKLYWIILGTALILACLFSFTSRDSVIATLYFSIFIVFFAILTVEIEVIFRYRAKKAVRSFGPEYFTTPKCLTLTENGLEYRTVYETTQFATRAVEKTERNDRFVTITIRGDLHIFIPTGVPGLSEFYSALLAKIGALQPLAK